MEIYAKSYGVVPGKDVARELNKALVELAKIQGEKTLIFEKDDYFLDVKNCPRETYHITNTIAEGEYRRCEEKFMHTIGIHLKGISDLTFEGNGATFIIKGYATNMVISESQNVTFKNFTIKSLQPKIYVMHIRRFGIFSADLTFEENTLVEVKDGFLYLGDMAEEFRMGKGKTESRVYLNVDDSLHPTHYMRWRNPLKNAWKFEKISEREVKAYGIFNPWLFRKSFKYYYFDCRRNEVGVFIDRCKNVTFDAFTQNYAPSLSIVGQDSENITLERLRLCPEEGKEVQMYAVADFIHMCCCRGKITVRDSYFSSANDDVINVHGIHFIISKIEGRKIIVNFKHPEAYGFNVFHSGDRLAIIDKRSLLELGQAVVESSKMVDLYTVEITLKEPVESKHLGNAIENISACADLLFEGNTSERVSTRSILVTSRGKIEIRNNHFIYGKMKILEISDDALGWYESGMVKDVTFEGNRIDECEDYIVSVLPCNPLAKGYVHSNVTIKNNVFRLGRHKAYIFRCVKNVRLSGNKYIGKSRRVGATILSHVDIQSKDF